MTISKDTENVINAVKYISGDSLRKSNDLAALIELSATYNASAELNKLIFSGKSAWNLQSKLNKITSTDEGAELLKRELYNNIYQMKEIISKIISQSDKITHKRFDDIYLIDTKGAMKNLIDLSFDLSIMKELQNQIKRSK